MDFVSIRIITSDPQRLAGFYARVTGVSPIFYTDDFAEVVTPSGTLAIAHERTMKLFGEGAARAADNRSVILELRVADVDAEFRKLQGVVPEVVQEPTTMPWGNRSLLFRDPDGNLVNYFTPVTPQAVARFEGRGRS
jgi:catechol 2,3-dioxygenase-like lactoylglutathione lyase family enzyme